MKTIAVTLGDPAGVGPEVVAGALGRFKQNGVRLIVLGSAKAAARAGIDASLVQACGPEVAPDRPGPESGQSALAAVERATELALAKKVDAVVTAPVSKRHIAESGVPFIGHTEYLAGRAHVKHPVMLFVASTLRVSLVTTHLALKKVAGAISIDRVVATSTETAKGLRTFFGVLEPRLAIAGINPHAGEGGQFGREEIDVLAPAVELLRKSGVKASGPFSADTLFRRAIDGEFDAVVAMYHDQALGPVKTVASDSVNVTLGLPFIRTSVDHGTGFDIARAGKADSRPMEQALRVALGMLQSTGNLL